MIFNWRTWVAGGLLGICWLTAPAIQAGETGVPAEAPPGTMTIFGEVTVQGDVRDFSMPDGTPLPAPAIVRHWVYRDADDEPYCLELLPGDWVTVLNETFTTGMDTTYVELDYNGQFNADGGLVDPYQGLLFRAWLIDGPVNTHFPGAGDGFNPFLARRDEGRNGQFSFGRYNGTLYVDPDTEVTLVIQLKATETDDSACFQNIMVRYD